VNATQIMSSYGDQLVQSILEKARPSTTLQPSKRMPALGRE